jgi:hypothetical protein
MGFNLMHGDCLERMKEIPDGSVDSIVTDPPYGLAFMGKRWDYDVPSVEIWEECLRVLKPGGHLLAFAGTRTQHRMAVRIEDAGFEIRDMIAWVYGTGFPKSLDVSKAIDKAAGAERDVTREGQTKAPEDAGKFDSATSAARERRDNPATDAARQWQGWGTALKPALEPITVARKPFKGTVAANVLAHGTGALNIDGCRIGTERGVPASLSKSKSSNTFGFGSTQGHPRELDPNVGRWPANLIHDGSDEVVVGFPATGPSKSGGKAGCIGYHAGGTGADRKGHDDHGGSAARFFYCAKASKKDRDEGLGAFAAATAGEMTGGREEGSAGLNNPRAGAGRTGGGRNIHPTVKPTDLMRYLCRLVTPPSGIVLDPFMGSGSTGKAARLEGFRFIGIERDENYFNIASNRIKEAMNGRIL